MVNSFSSWKKMNESVASGKEVMIDPVTGKKHKVTYKVQTANKFVMKIINDLDILDENERLTPQGINAITSYLNREVPFTRAIGELTPNFFTGKFIVYTVLADGSLFGRPKQKIQFEVIERTSGIQGMPGFTENYPGVPDTVQFIDADSFKSLSQLAPDIVDKLKTAAQAAQLPDPTPSEEAAPAPKETEEVKKELGKRFLYTMRTNSKLYMMEFTDAGTIKAEPEDGSDPKGIVSYDKATEKVLWTTALDDSSKDAKVQKNVGTPLFFDSEITNQTDRSFFKRIFTDESFRRKTIEDYEKEYGGSELDVENLKKMLFYKDGTPMFTSTEITPDSQKRAPSGEKSLSGEEQIAQAQERLTKLRDQLKSQFRGEQSPS